jgi:hypothetical protein
MYSTRRGLSFILARFHAIPWSVEASARSQRGGMRCCQKLSWRQLQH